MQPLAAFGPRVGQPIRDLGRRLKVRFLDAYMSPRGSYVVRLKSVDDLERVADDGDVGVGLIDGRHYSVRQVGGQMIRFEVIP